MKNWKIESRLLSAYIDRELDEQSRQEVEEILRWTRTQLSYGPRKKSAMIRMSLDAHLNTTEARTAQKILDDRLKKYREKTSPAGHEVGTGCWIIPFCGGGQHNAAFIGYLVGSLFVGNQAAKADYSLGKEKEISLAAVEERDRILEYMPSGQTMKWKSDNGLVQAELTPILNIAHG